MVERTRSLGFWVAFAMGLGTMIAAGIFSLSGQAVHDVGSSAVVAFVIAAVVAGVTAASYSEFASIYAQNGGGYLFSSQTFDSDRLTFAVGMSLFLGYTGTTAFYLATMDHWVRKFILPAGIHLPHGLVGILTALALGALNAGGTEESGTFQVAVTGLKVIVLLIFVGGALQFAGVLPAVGEFAGNFETKPVGIVSTAGTAFITFFGFSAIAASAGEIIEPRKNVPKAIAASMLTVTVLYIFVIVALVNTPASVRGALTAGETAMGTVAKAFIGPIGQWVIVAGAVFSMISASNASILAGSGIGYLMGRRGQAPRDLSRVHPDYETPLYAVGAVTGAIVALIAVFVWLLGAGGPVHIGLAGLTNFATLNLLAPLAVVNVALVYSRRRHPDLDRPFEVPFGSVLPVVGVVANVALIGFLAVKGMRFGSAPEGAQFVTAVGGTTVALLPSVLGLVAGVVVEVVAVAAYLAWGGEADVEDLVSEVETPEPADEAAATTADEDAFTVLVPVERVQNAATFGRIAARLGRKAGTDTVVRFLRVTQVPDQTPTDAVDEVAAERASRLTEALDDADLAVSYEVDAHVSRDLGYDIVSTARDVDADRIVMGYPEKNVAAVEKVEYDAPCDTVFVDGEMADADFDRVVVGAGAGPHHEALLASAPSLVQSGGQVHVVSVVPRGNDGTPEDAAETTAAFDEATVEHHDVHSSDVATSLVLAAEEHDAVLLVGASRTRRLRRWVFGSTPDRVVERADEAGVPVLVYAAESGAQRRLEEWSFPVYRYLRRAVPT
ncbi:amino acid permease [Haloarchaeobius amylolyticus]|uniref:amino acid permease n=1 Tax=Haloarchaeobius amylolyticus TaxID=1198296 RepID=UPI0022708D2D|nr:amino acid permease [Haloarchaeobius amylolyticus]